MATPNTMTTATVSTLLDALSARPDAGLTIQLPDGSTVPAHFHVTEVGRVRKDFIDCGGTVRAGGRCVLPVWVGGDLADRAPAGEGADDRIAGGVAVLGDPARAEQAVHRLEDLLLRIPGR